MVLDFIEVGEVGGRFFLFWVFLVLVEVVLAWVWAN